MRFHHHVAVLKNRYFSLLWLSQIASEIAYHVVTFSLVVLVYQLTHHELFVTALVALIGLAPILFSPFAGLAADSFDRRSVMLLSHVLRLGLGFVMLIFFPFPYVLLVIAFLLASVAQFVEPAQAAAIPALVPKEQLFTANAYFSFTRYIMFLVGYTIAGPLLTGLGPTGIFCVIIGLYVVVLSATLWVRPLKEHLSLGVRFFGTGFSHALRSIPRQFADGVAFITKDRIVALAILQVSAIFAIEKGIIALAPSFMPNWLGLSVSEISLLVILPTGIGTLLGSIVVNYLKQKLSRHFMITFGTFVDALSLIALAVFVRWVHSASIVSETPIHIAALALAFFTGLAAPCIIIPAQTVVQERTPKEKRGRVFGNLIFTMNLFTLVPVFALGLLSERISTGTIMVGFGLLMALIGFICALYWHKFRREPELQPGT